MAKIQRNKQAVESENSRQWEKLIKNVADGNVIPVIGPEFLVDDEDYPDTHNAHTILLNELAQYYELENVPASFSELFFELKPADRFNFYSTLGDIFEEGFQLSPSKLLKEILSINQFPFVITTSFMPVVEDCMREIWGKINVLTFNNNEQSNDDIKSADDLMKPTVYYMFGKVCRSDKTYVVTDTDMLSFCKSWLSQGSRPEMLSAVLKDKYLLFLGNNYSDWLCRFVWYSLKSSFDNNPGMMVDRFANDALLQFLKRIDAFTQEDAQMVVGEIKRQLKEKFGSDEQLYFENVTQRADVFISYSRSDKSIVEKLYKTLRNKGLIVWYDKFSLGQGEKFMREIRQGIRTTKFFIPLITSNIEKEKNEAHIYRQEWRTAIERAEEYGRAFLLPLAEEGFNFYESSLPEEFLQHNATFYNADEPDFDAFAESLKQKLISIQ